MNIYYLQEFWLGEHYYKDTNLHPHYLTIELPEVNIDAQIWLTIFSPGFNFDKGVTGIAAAGVKSCRFIDQNGAPQYHEFTSWESHLWIARCTEVTFAFQVRLAWAAAEGIIYWHDHPYTDLQRSF